MASGDHMVERVKSAERVLEIIEALSTEVDGMTFSLLQHALGIPKSSLHALLDVLTSRSYLEYDSDTRRYTLGIRVWESGQAYQSRHNLLREALPIMERIVAAINETIQLATLDGTENVYLAKVDSSQPLRLQSEVGKRLSAHATALGKMLLSQLPDEEVRTRFGSGPPARLSPNTITTMDELLHELALTRERGFSVDNQEYTPGLCCLAVPIYNHQQRMIAAMSVSIPTMRATLDLLATTLSLLASGSLHVSQRMGNFVRDERLLRLQNSAVAHELLAQLHDRLNFSLQVDGQSAMLQADRVSPADARGA